MFSMKIARGAATQQPMLAQMVATTGLSLDQTRFAIAFLSAVLAGLFIRLLRNPTGALLGREAA
jgi:hypothetical protein